VIEKSATLAYIVGVALGDGNLSCPNGRALRLRVTCDNKYPDIIEEITDSLSKIFPHNKVSLCKRYKDTCCDISVYSNKLAEFMPWEINKGTKIDQSAHIPTWILDDLNYTSHCLKGLIQTDGSIYRDRKYLMVNFTNLIKPLIDDVFNMMSALGFHPKIQSSAQKNGNVKYVVRLSKDVASFIEHIELSKT
jgi:DNA-binding transcriptional regulator WhiA